MGEGRRGARCTGRRPAAGELGATDQEREILTFALEACDRARSSPRRRRPWLALRARLARLRGDDVGGDDPAAGADSEGEPGDVGSERSALAAFQWARLDFPDGQMGRSLAWMRHAVRLEGDDYWYQYFLGYLEDLAGHPDEALEHYSIAAALAAGEPVRPVQPGEALSLEGELGGGLR